MNEDWKALRDMSARFQLKNDLNEAIKYLKRAISLASGANNLDIALMHNRLASLYMKNGEYRLAEEAARKTLAIELEFGDCGVETTNLADYYIMLGRSLESQNRFVEAVQYVQKSVDIFEALLGEDCEYVQGAKTYLGSLKDKSWMG